MAVMAVMAFSAKPDFLFTVDAAPVAVPSGSQPIGWVDRIFKLTQRYINYI
jgi:hypothetical protein